MKIFLYSSEDLIIENIDSTNSYKKNKSKFDDLLLKEWLSAMENGYFKFKLDSQIQTKIINNGDYSFVFQLNSKRFTEKRKAETITKLDKPFDPEIFNFTKIKDHEILFNLVKNDDEQTFIIINNSPIETGHVLIVPKIHACQNQVLNQNSFEIAVEVSLLSNSYGFFVGFNSLCALASVNHLHFHAYYLDYILPIQKIKSKKLFKKLWLIDDYFLPAFGLQLSDFDDNIEDLARHVYIIANYLTKHETAHNLMICKGDNFNEESLRIYTLRVIIWPRKSLTGSKDDDKNITFQLAICELSGHIVIKDENTFNNLTANEISNAAKEIRLDDELFEKIVQDIENLFE